MHDNCMALIHRFAETYRRFIFGRLLEVGSRDVNGSPRSVLQGMVVEYVGVDLEPGPGVDVVLDDELTFYSESYEKFEVVVCVNVLEHTLRPWLVMENMADSLAPGGIMLLVAPWQWEIHRYPVDCWRILPDGARSLMVDEMLEVLECETSEFDTYAVARKPA